MDKSGVIPECCFQTEKNGIRLRFFVIDNIFIGEECFKTVWRNEKL
jgi:hypothetical protein